MYRNPLAMASFALGRVLLHRALVSAKLVTDTTYGDRKVPELNYYKTMSYLTYAADRLRVSARGSGHSAEQRLGTPLPSGAFGVFLSTYVLDMLPDRARNYLLRDS